ncbi:exodeoxyribonuclease V subunit alpha [Echinimonas agarilytica]|uniref:RecBCD enzyme subunit RecD n=1 Tax=Echinimonas agarilytica TaxID=1215918 RepID=A0AA41W8U2_9GAMM|nr:exodeoxyribonuclease V subunit alpha [Echinimonas agarilytica]MCM2681230.1 exodeoxyribonuclease V subunit alpha [Echinimonas agarilytica]
MSVTLDDLERAASAGLIRAIDYQFTRHLLQKAHQASSLLVTTGYLLSRSHGDNHVCIDMATLAETHVLLWPKGPSMTLPELDEWKHQLNAESFVQQTPLMDDGIAPLIIDSSRLYLARYWHYENKVAAGLNQRSAHQYTIQPETVIHQLNALFDGSSHDVDWQKTACVLALMKQLVVITGGPGTGKTTTVIRLLALILQQQINAENFVIRLVAPTGKAAVRMTESIRSAKGHLVVDDTIKRLIPEQASTIHRLLGAIPNSVAFRHSHQNKLHIDLLVVDEASMVDLPMMAKLLDALPEHCRIVLLGDKDQLSSVEAGSVLGDICSSINTQKTPIHMRYSPTVGATLTQLNGTDYAEHIDQQSARQIDNCLCMLQKSYRFGGGIGALANAVNQGAVDLAQAVLEEHTHADVELIPNGFSSLISLSMAAYQPFFNVVGQDHRLVLNTFDRFRVLCASRNGELGTHAINEAIEQQLRRNGLIPADTEFYSGRPIMIQRNDYNVKLFNGDIGIVLPASSESLELRVYFPQSDGSVRAILPTRLPAHETAYAMTIHKSQGSEFEHIAIALPDAQRYGKLLTRELLYTGITRAKSKVSLSTSMASIRLSIMQSIERISGLTYRLK